MPMINKAGKALPHAYDEAGSMTIKLNTACRACPSQELTDTVNVYAFPVVDLRQEQSLCLRGQPLLLTNSREEAAQKLLWSTGDTTISIYVKHPGEYSLTVSNIWGCATTETVTVLGIQRCSNVFNQRSYIFIIVHNSFSCTVVKRPSLNTHDQLPEVVAGVLIRVTAPLPIIS